MDEVRASSSIKSHDSKTEGDKTETGRVLVTGVAGFLGPYVADQLTSDGMQVVGFDLIEPRDQMHEFVKGNFTSEDDLGEAFQGINTVCHLGGIGDVYLAERNPELAFKVNAYGTLKVCEACHSAGVGKLIYASTWEVYGKPRYQPVDEEHPCNPEGPYSISKLAGDLFARSAGSGGGLKVTVLRLGTAYGTHMRDTAVIPRFLRRAREGKPLTVFGDGSQFRQFTHARDVARAFSLAITVPHASAVYNIVAAEKVTLVDLVKCIAKSFEVGIEYQAPRPGEPPSGIISSARAKQELGWMENVTFSAGLQELMAGQSG